MDAGRCVVLIEKVDIEQTVVTKSRHRKEWIAELVEQNKWTHGAELGVYMGATIFYVLRRCPKLHMIGVDLWAAQPDNPGLETYTAARLRHDFHYLNVMQLAVRSKRARIIRADTVLAADLVEDGSLDFVFIDADHCRVAEDIAAWRPKLKPEGKLIGHDINWKVVREDVDRLIVDYHVGPNQCWMQK